MRVTDALRGEHGVFYAQFDHIEADLPGVEKVGCIHRSAALLGAALAPHARIENELLFRPLEAEHPPAAAPMAVMLEEHDRIEGLLGDIEAMEDVDRARAMLLEAIDLARGHFEKEERIAFPLAESAFDEGRLIELAEEWARRRRVALVSS